MKDGIAMADERQSPMKVSQAVEVSARYLTEIYPGIKEVRVEEVELSDDDQFWMITLGFLFPATDADRGLLNILPPRRVYRIFKIDRNSGEIRSMKMREPANV
jgi:hypothetical protein